VNIEPLAGALGAEVSGLDLATPLSDAEFEDLLAAFHRYQVVFLPCQDLTPAQHRDFAIRFGELDIPVFVPPFETPAVDGHPEIYQLTKAPDSDCINIGGFWHADVTHRETPNLASIAYVREAPSHGGDTLFANLYAAFEALSPGMRTMLEGMNAVHSSSMPYGRGSVRSTAVSSDHVRPAGASDFQMDQVEEQRIETIHPVVRRHPVTARQSLYVNRGFTSHFEGWTMAESHPLLDYLWKHAEQPEFTCRYRWAVGTVGIWDNRCVLHYALNDYYGQRRLLHRISVNEASRPEA
jgi:taurine dioxygenase